MKKILCYMLRSIFLLAILSACERDDPPAPTFADLEGEYTGDSDLALNFLLTPAIPITSDKTTDGAQVIIAEGGEGLNNLLLITLTGAQLSIKGKTPVAVDGGFLFTVDNLARENDEIVFDIGDEGIGSIIERKLLGETIIALNLTDVQATKATAGGIALRANATIPRANATAFIAVFDSSAPEATETVDVTITLSVDNITNRRPSPPPIPAPTLADLAGTYRGDSYFSLFFLPSPQFPLPVGFYSNKTIDGTTVVVKDAAMDNMIITLTDAQLLAENGMPMEVDGVFTFTRSIVASDGEFVLDIGDEGSADLTVGSGVTPITDLALTNVGAPIRRGISVRANATLTATQATALIQAFDPSAPAATEAVEVEIMLDVDNITENDP